MSSAPRAADARPLPREETTPPVMKINRAMGPLSYPIAVDSARTKLTRENRRSAGRIQARFWSWGGGRPPRGEWKLPTFILLGASHKRAMLWTTARGAANLISSEAADGSANDPQDRATSSREDAQWSRRRSFRFHERTGSAG